MYGNLNRILGRLQLSFLQGDVSRETAFPAMLSIEITTLIFITKQKSGKLNLPEGIYFVSLEAFVALHSGAPLQDHQVQLP